MNSDPKITLVYLSRMNRRDIWLLGGLLLLVVAAVAVAVATFVAPPPQVLRAEAVTYPQEMAALTQRCNTEMLRGTCGAMNASAAKPGASRLFIAGVGEVDAAAFATLRAAGTEMCNEAATACRQDWNSNTCRITRALYPLAGANVNATAGAGAGAGAK